MLRVGYATLGFADVASSDAEKPSDLALAPRPPARMSHRRPFPPLCLMLGAFGAAELCRRKDRMTTLSRIRAAKPFDTIPAPPPSAQPLPTDDTHAPPESRRVDSRRRDTIPAPPPVAGVEGEADEEAVPSTERAPFAMEQVG